MSVRLSLPGHRLTGVREARLVLLGVLPVTALGALLSACGVLATRTQPWLVGHRALSVGAVALEALLAGVIMVVPLVLFKRRALAGDPLLYPTALLLWGIGYWCSVSLGGGGHSRHLQSHPVIGLGLGSLLFALLALMPADHSSSRWRVTRFDLPRYAYILGLAAVGLILALAMATAARHRVVVSLGGVQLGDIGRMLLVVFAAGVLSETASITRSVGVAATLRTVWHASGPVVIVWAAALLLAAAGKDYGPAAVMLVTLASLLSVRHGKWWIVASVLVVVGFAVAGANALGLGVIPTRVAMWLDPWQNGLAGGNQVAEAHWALATGGLGGSGLGLGQAHRVAQSADDLVLASVGEQLGFLGVIGVLLLLALLSTRAIVAGLRAQTVFDTYLSLGVGMFIAIQSLVISAGVCGAIPLTGISVPFVAHGNTGIVCWFALLGLVRAVSAAPVRGGLPDQGLRTGARAVVILIWTLLVGGVGAFGFGGIQLAHGTALATRQIRTKHRDGQRYYDDNPRLTLMARSVRRGRIVDARGRILADGPVASRQYPYGSAGVHLVGMASDLYGRSGLERECDMLLRGYRDDQLLAAYRAKDLPWSIGHALPKSGTSIVATIDGEWQRHAEQLLRYGAVGTSRRPGARGALVVIDLMRSEVVVSVSVPGYDPTGISRSRWAELQAKAVGGGSPFLDRARHGYYAPGSTLKVPVAAIAIEAGLVPVYRCNHATAVSWRYQGQAYSRDRISDLESMRAHGNLGMEAAIAASCNVYFAQLGRDMGAEMLHDGLSRYSFSRLPTVSAVAQALPDTAFGQGAMLATPTEMALVAATVANGGVQPRLRYWRAEGGDPAPAHDGVRVMKKTTAGRLAAMMGHAVSSGTGRGLFNGLGFSVAGKTGSAEVGGDALPHSWFMGFCPRSRPRFAFACVVENGGHGRSAAAPICRDFLRSVLASP